VETKLNYVDNRLEEIDAPLCLIQDVAGLDSETCNEGETDSFEGQTVLNLPLSYFLVIWAY